MPNTSRVRVAVLRAGGLLAGLVLTLAAAGCTNTTPTVRPIPDPTAAAPDPTIVAADLKAGLALFADDQSAADFVTIAPDPEDSTTWAHVSELTYAALDHGTKGGTVTALLIEPTDTGLRPAVIMLSGLPGTRRDLLPRAVDLANAGVVSLLIDPPQARATRTGPGTQPLNFSDQDRDEQIQLVVDLRHAFDVLAQRRNVDEVSIGFLGSGDGAAIGGLFAGVEPRLRGAVLESGDGGHVSHFTALGGASPLATLPPAVRDHWLAVMAPIEPLYFVGNAAAPVFFQLGRLDTEVTPLESARFAAAGNKQSRVGWYDSGHGLGTPAWCDAAIWLGDNIGFDGTATTSCGASAGGAVDNGLGGIALLGILALLIGVRLVLRLRRRPPPPPPGAAEEEANVTSRPIIRPPEREPRHARLISAPLALSVTLQGRVSPPD